MAYPGFFQGGGGYFVNQNCQGVPVEGWLMKNFPGVGVDEDLSGGGGVGVGEDFSRGVSVKIIRGEGEVGEGQRSCVSPYSST